MSNRLAAYVVTLVSLLAVIAAGGPAAAAKRACSNGDLSRIGIASAWRGLSDADTGGLLPILDYAKAGAPPTRQVLIAKPDPTVDGGLTVVQPFFVSDLAKQYKAPAEA